MTVLARITLDDTLRLRIRRMSTIRAVLLAKRLIAAYGTLPPDTITPEGRALLTLRASELEARAAAMETGAAPPAPPPISLAPSDAALALASREVLEVPVEVDRLLESHIRRVHDAAVAFKDDADEVGEAARLLMDHLFEGGRRFVILPLDEQFQETTRRLGELGDRGVQAAALLRRAEAYAAIGVLNSHLGQLLHITTRPAAAPESTQANAAGALASSLNAWLAAVIAVWPEDAPAQLAARRALLQPLADELSR